MSLTKVYSSAHTGAPASVGNANGTLQAILDAVLVNGYNSKTVTITRTGSTATANSVAHGFTTGQVLVHSGADQAEYNVEARITVVDANNYTFAVSGTPATPATGTITAKVAPLGWSVAFSSGNDRSYLRPAGSRGFYLNVSDGGATNYARVRMFETVTAAGVAAANGTNPTPSETSAAGGGYFYNSNTTDTVARDWLAYGNAEAFVLVTYQHATNYLAHLYVGDVNGGHAAYGVAVWANWTVGTTGNGMSNAGDEQAAAGSFPLTSPYILRPLSGSAASERIGAHAFNMNNVVMGVNSSGPAYATYGLIISRFWAMQAARGVFGFLPGLWAPTNNRPLARDDTFSGAAGSTIADKTFRCVATTQHAQFYVETSDNW